MFIPIGTDRPCKRPTLVTYWLVGVCVIVFIAGLALKRNDPGEYNRLMDLLMLHPVEARFRWWQLFSYQFLHATWMHLLGNMLVLFVFGPPVEDRFGRLGFLAFYLAGGAAAGGVHMVFEPSSVLGASGAIAGVTGAFLVLFPMTHVRVLLFFFLIGVYQIPAWWFIAFAIAKDIFFQGLGGGGVAYMAHLGGYAYGAVIVVALLWAKAIPREPFDLFSIGRQAKRRRDFKSLTSKGAAPWRSDIPVKSKVAANGKTNARQEQLTAKRGGVLSRVAAGELDRAADEYLALLDEDADAVMSRDAQLVIANHLAGRGRHLAAVAAYDRFIARFPTDRETPRLKLMVAILSARYLNDPVRASKILGELRTAPLDDSLRRVAAELAQEIA